MSPGRLRPALIVAAVLMIAIAIGMSRSATVSAHDHDGDRNAVARNAVSKVEQGEQVFRFDTFGDQSFWGDTIKLHQAIEGAKLGGVGPGVSPKTALAVGLKVDIDALPRDLLEKIEKGRVNLDDPAVTLALLKLNAVVGVKGTRPRSGRCSGAGVLESSMPNSSSIERPRTQNKLPMAS